MKRITAFLAVMMMTISSLVATIQPVQAASVNCKVLDPYYVSQVQRALTNKGYKPGSIDGYMGTNTCNAIKSFQKAKKLTADGVVGANTGKALGLSSAISCGSSVSTCFLAVERTGYQGNVYAIKNNKVIRKVPATFGGYGHRTPTGTTPITRVLSKAHTSGEHASSTPNMNYPMYFDKPSRGIAIHGSKALGSTSGTNACVRVGWDEGKNLQLNYYKKQSIKTVVVRR